MAKKMVAGAALAAMLALPARGATLVDVELQLLVDVSGSIDETEFGLQRQGYADAFNDPLVQAAILDTSDGKTGAIAVQMIYWSGPTSIAVDWTLIDSAAAAAAFASAILAVDRPFEGATQPATAIQFGTGQFAGNDFDAAQQIMDISGDGPGTQPATTSGMRDNALASGIDQINGIIIEGEEGLEDWYRSNIIGGTDAFLIATSGFDSFGDALKLKLRAEIEGTSPGQLGDVPLPAPAFLLIGGLAGLALLGRRRSTG
ncbi:DUF1194 domain-containing protein [Paralimibaculum aggregatum]|uniref:DUF1194 domain-containing protein n=2 Tax=Paralimibaculum aggregatum TaxID=3036245 RepID=A0ABQ6LIV2_9RHOB|nr:DUF1194 domain-containing protein [Limibaculum sp. NKW23]